jgi:hypothetical protein
MPRYFIYVYYQQGNVGPHCVEALKDQPEDGFTTEEEAEEYLRKLIEERKGYFFDRDWYKFTILKTFLSKSALDLQKFTKVIKFRGLEWKQDVEVLDCIMCKYSIGCSSWGCVSASCEITAECFALKSIGTWCPFGEVPEDKKFLFKD